MIGSSVVAKRYAQALFDLAGEEKDYIKFQSELKEMNSLIDGASDLKEFFVNPVFEDARKEGRADRGFKENFYIAFDAELSEASGR